MDKEKYLQYMDMAIKEAKKAYDSNEVPIGCVIVHNDTVIGKGANLRTTKNNVLAHAEIIAINEACNYINDWRLEDCTLFVTVEPCPMCAGAILQARVKEVVYGARNPKAGCAGSIYNILQDDRFNHTVAITEGVRQKECTDLMQSFFKKFREKSDLQSIPNVGKNTEKHLNSLGIYSVEDLKGKNPEELYERECNEKGEYIDRCVLYMYRMAVYYANNTEHDPKKLKWSYWKDKKKG